MRSRALIAAVLAPLLIGLGAGPAAPGTSTTADGDDTVLAAALPSARLGSVVVERRSTKSRLSATVHVDRARKRLGFRVSFTRGTPDTWGRVWIGKRDGQGGCTRAVVMQGRDADISTWTVRDSDGAVPIAHDYSRPGSRTTRLLVLNRPSLPDACAVAELWTGDSDGPKNLVLAGERDITRAISDGAAFTQLPIKFRLRWGQATIIPVDISSSLTGPSALSNVRVALEPVGGQGPVVDAAIAPAPVDWDFWKDGFETSVNMKVTPTQEWGTRARPSFTTDKGTWLRKSRRLQIWHPRPTDWEGSLAGRTFWNRRDALPWSIRRLTFQNDTWVYIHDNGAVVPQCTESSPRWRRGCRRYWYDEASGRLQIGQLRARVTDDGWWWQGETYDRSDQVRTLAPGETRFYRGRGKSVECCPLPRARVWLWKNGRYRVERGRQVETGHYRSLARGTIRIDKGARGGRTRRVTLSFFGRVVDGRWETHTVWFADTRTRPY